MPPLSKKLVRDIRLTHVKQLAQFDLPTGGDTPGKAPKGLPPIAPAELLATLLGGIDDNPGALQAAKDTRKPMFLSYTYQFYRGFTKTLVVYTECSSAAPSKPNWDAVFFSFIESCAMYLRKDTEVTKAVLAARGGDYDAAITHLDSSQEDIDTVARAMGCTFVQLCDFAQLTPEGTCLHSGAYAGLFIRESGVPMMGVAFKGSNSTLDIITDVDWRPIAPLQPDIAWGAQVHRGFYYGLFGQFTTGDDSQVPFDILVEQLSTAYMDEAKLHFTGHSLGGGYCTMAYGEFLRRQAEPGFAKFNLGDLYSLGAPRTCLLPFAFEVNKRTEAGAGHYSFRIVNKQDPVPTIPPPPYDWNLDAYPFAHVGGAWKITDTGPEKMADEPPPVQPVPLEHMVREDHYPRGYYASWQKTPHS